MLLCTNKDFYYTFTILRVKCSSLIRTLLYALSCNEYHTIHFMTIGHLCVHSISFSVLPDRFHYILYKSVTLWRWSLKFHLTYIRDLPLVLNLLKGENLCFSISNTIRRLKSCSLINNLDTSWPGSVIIWLYCYQGTSTMSLKKQLKVACQLAIKATEGIVQLTCLKSNLVAFETAYQPNVPQSLSKNRLFTAIYYSR